MEIREQDQYDTLNGWRVVDAAAIPQFVYPGTIYSWGRLSSSRVREKASNESKMPSDGV
ncbi:hypothetical protein FOFC_21262 [Fusarium oxysporum]|nr:hypothetical protein FOFC_21262 [Fusarium oxysporum]